MPGSTSTTIRSWRAIAFTASAAAGALHLAAARPHFHEYAPAGVFMLVAGATQLVWALAVSATSHRRMYQVAVAANTAIVVLWFVSRTAGLPIGPNAGMSEHIHAPDALATALEILLIVAAVQLLTERPRKPDPALIRLAIVGAFLAPTVASHDPITERLTTAAALGFALALRAAIPHLPRLTWRTDVEAPHVRLGNAARDVVASGAAVGAR